MSQSRMPPKRLPHKKDEPILTPAQRRSLVERRITEAMEQGAFDNLPGTGKPLKIDPPSPYHEELWWALRILKNANVVTDEIRYRQRIDALRARLASAESERAVRKIVRAMNEWIIKLNTMGTNVIPTSLGPLDEEAAVRRFHDATT